MGCCDLVFIYWSTFRSGLIEITLAGVTVAAGILLKGVCPFSYN